MTITFQPLTPGAVTHGTIAGALNTAELISSFMTALGSECHEGDVVSLYEQLKQASDIVLHGDNAVNGPGQPCNAISIGLGFDAVELAPPTQVVDALDAGGCD